MAAAGAPENTEFHSRSPTTLPGGRRCSLPRVGLVDDAYRRLEDRTRDEHRGAEGFFQAHQLTAWGSFGLWKAGFVGLGAFAARWDYNPWAQRGTKAVFCWLETRIRVLESEYQWTAADEALPAVIGEVLYASSDNIE